VLPVASERQAGEDDKESLCSDRDSPGKGRKSVRAPLNQTIQRSEVSGCRSGAHDIIAVVEAEDLTEPGLIVTTMTAPVYTIWRGCKMSNEGNNVPGEGIIDRLSLAECELLCTLARGVPVGQVIVDLSSGEDEAATWLARDANEATGNNVHSVKTPDADYEQMIRRWKGKVGLWWYDASCEYEDVRKALLFCQRHLSPEARVVLRGYDQPGIARVIEEYVGNYGNFVLVDSVGTVAVLAVDRCVHYWVIDCNEFGICKYCGRKRSFKMRRGESRGIGTKKRVNGRKSK